MSYATEQRSSDSEECDEADVQRNEWAVSDDGDIISLRNQNSFVVNIFNNVVGLFSKLISTTAAFFLSTNQQRTNDGSTQPAKRRRLNEDADESSASSVLVDQASQTDQSFVHTASFGHDELPEQQDETDEEQQDETDEEQPQEAHHVNEQPIIAEEEYDGDNFDPFKYLEQHDRTPVDPNRRITTFMGNRCYRERQERMRRGMIGQLFFGSHQQPTKNLETSRNPSNVNAQRRADIWSTSQSLRNKRFPPEQGGSIFYHGFTQYGGASSVMRVPRNPTGQDRDVLISSGAQSTRGTKRRLDENPNPPAESYTTRRIKEIMKEFDAKKAANELPTMTNESISLELTEICKRHNMNTYEMLEEQKYPPIVPLINVMPLPAYNRADTTEQQEAAPAVSDTITDANATAKQSPKLLASNNYKVPSAGGLFSKQ